MSISSQLPPITPTTYATSATPTKPATTNALASGSANKTQTPAQKDPVAAAVAEDDGDWQDDGALGSKLDTTA
jgi:hypothetical protein